MKVVAIVPSAGRGVRIKRRKPKAFLKIGDKPIIAYTLQALNKASCIDEIILAVAGEDEIRAERIVKKYKIGKLTFIVQGGATRFESVSNCLRFIDGDTGYILIHDGVRPFIDGDTIRRAVSAARKTGACLVGVPLIPTVKKVDGNLEIVSTPPRDRLWVAQTPQVFKKEIILKAYKLAHGFAERRAGRRRNVPTDDAMLVERLGKRVKIVRGSYRNIKITTPEDLKLAEVLK